MARTRTRTLAHVRPMPNSIGPARTAHDNDDDASQLLRPFKRNAHQHQPTDLQTHTHTYKKESTRPRPCTAGCRRHFIITRRAFGTGGWCLKLIMRGSDGRRRRTREMIEEARDAKRPFALDGVDGNGVEWWKVGGFRWAGQKRFASRATTPAHDWHTFVCVFAYVRIVRSKRLTQFARLVMRVRMPL